MNSLEASSQFLAEQPTKRGLCEETHCTRCTEHVDFHHAVSPLMEKATNNLFDAVLHAAMNAPRSTFYTKENFVFGVLRIP